MAKKVKKDKIVAYWDSSLFIKWLKEEDRWQEVDAVLQKARNDEMLIVTSALTLAEVVKIDAERKIPKKEREKVVALFDEPMIEKISITPITGVLARDLVWEHNIDPKDALHVAAAFERRVPVFHCYDGRLKKRGEKSVLNLFDFEMSFMEPLDSIPEVPQVITEGMKYEQTTLFVAECNDGNGAIQPISNGFAPVTPKT